MQAKDIRERFINFFEIKAQHARIPSASIVPENDPTVLFTTAGMQPLVPYLLGEKHPKGTRLANSQKCLRTDDIDEVGDNTHCTFFEMLGNWSLGDYFKKETIQWSYELLTTPVEEGGFGLDPDRLCVTCYEGDEIIPRDEEAASYWEELGFIKATEAKQGEFKRIFFFDRKENWWGPAGQTGPCGPDTEIFYYVGDPKDPKYLDHTYAPNTEDDLYVEIWNNVFMQYNKNEDGTYTELEQKNIDTGMGLERMTSIMQGVDSPFKTELFSKVMDLLESQAIESEGEEREESKRIICDHLRAATFMLGDPNGIAPSNTDQGYILRRLIRRAIRHAHKLGITEAITCDIAKIYIAQYKGAYPELKKNSAFILEELAREESQFAKTLKVGEKEFYKMLEIMQKHGGDSLSGRVAFKLYDTYGFPLEMTQELAKENQIEVDVEGFNKAFKKHQELSRAGAEQKFKGGLADNTEETTKLHTATHLLHKALKQVLGGHVEQKGSNITVDRLRFDFSHPDKMTPEQIAEVEKIVNDQIQADLPVTCTVTTVEDAKSQGAIGLFGDKYGDEIKLYGIGDFSLEICGGPHVERTGDMGTFKIKKEQSSSRGVRRIKAVLIS